jgi:hypothetical protein
VLETWEGLLTDGTRKVSELTDQVIKHFGYVPARVCWVPGALACWQPPKVQKIKKGQFHPLITQYPQELTVADLEAFIVITWDPVIASWRVYTKGDPDQDVHKKLTNLMDESEEWAAIWDAWNEDQVRRRQWSYSRRIIGLQKKTVKVGPKGELPAERKTRAKEPTTKVQRKRRAKSVD